MLQFLYDIKNGGKFGRVNMTAWNHEKNELNWGHTSIGSNEGTAGTAYFFIKFTHHVFMIAVFLQDEEKTDLIRHARRESHALFCWEVVRKWSQFYPWKAQPALSQLGSFKIRRTPFLNLSQFADLLIVRL